MCFVCFQDWSEYVTVENACQMHRDMSLLEGVVAAIGSNGPLGLCKWFTI